MQRKAEKGDAGKEKKKKETNKFSRLPTLYYLGNNGLLYIC